jgi:hypothetical protein
MDMSGELHVLSDLLLEIKPIKPLLPFKYKAVCAPNNMK